MKNYYEILKLQRNSYPHEISYSHNVLISMLSRNATAENIFMMNEIDEAHFILSNPQLRPIYDRSGYNATKKYVYGLFNNLAVVDKDFAINELNKHRKIRSSVLDNLTTVQNKKRKVWIIVGALTLAFVLAAIITLVIVFTK